MPSLVFLRAAGECQAISLHHITVVQRGVHLCNFVHVLRGSAGICAVPGSHPVTGRCVCKGRRVPLSCPVLPGLVMQDVCRMSITMACSVACVEKSGKVGCYAGQIAGVADINGPLTVGFALVVHHCCAPHHLFAQYSGIGEACLLQHIVAGSGTAGCGLLPGTNVGRWPSLWTK